MRYRLAEAHTRNTSETCVPHWPHERPRLPPRRDRVGRRRKGARISQAAHWRFFYYQTTDERAGDIMQMVAEFAGIAVERYDPMREAAARTPDEPHVRIRIGPDGSRSPATG
jgi:hypothetical protein